MHKYLRLTVFTICLLAISFLFFHPVLATDTESSHITETALLGNLKDDSSACGVFTVLNLVIDIFSIGVGVLAIIGITIVGIKYLTAGGNEEQTRKAKHRMSQIIVGVALYAVLYVGLQWLVPGGKLDYGNRCVVVSDEELAKIKEKEKAEREAQRQKNEEEAARIIAQKNSGRSSSSSSSNSSNNKESSELGKKILAEMGKTANIFVEKGVTFDNDHGATSWRELFRTKKSHCSSYMFLTLKRMGLMSRDGDTYFYFSDYGRTLKKRGDAKKDLKKNFVEIKGNDTIENLVKKGKLVPGDICGDGEYKAHTIMYAGQSGGKYKIHSFGSGKFSKSRHYNLTVSGSHKIGRILHAK